MAVQYSVTVRNAQLDAKETAIGTGPLLELWSGTKPASCAAADSAGAKLCTITLPSDWLAAAASGVKSKSGTWSGTGAAAASTGTAATHYRLYDSGRTTCHEQGSVTVTGGGGEITLDNVSIAENQAVTISSYSVTAGNA